MKYRTTRKHLESNRSDKRRTKTFSSEQKHHYPATRSNVCPANNETFINTGRSTNFKPKIANGKPIGRLNRIIDGKIERNHLDSMFEAVQLPASISDLDTGLADVD